MNPATLSDRWIVYGDALRLDAHQLLVWAHQDVRHKLHLDLDEPAITGLLCDAMNRRVDHPDTPDAFSRYYVGDQVPIDSEGRLGGDRLRLDVSVILNNIKPKIAYIFEAKRLRTGGFPIGRYTGREGMGDFIECRYAPASPEAAMIGLFQNRDVEYWHGELRRTFVVDAASVSPCLGIRAHPAPVEILPGLDGELESTHVRVDQSPMRLLHIFLDCS